MPSNRIIYADLSTYNPSEIMPFYENVFAWKYYESYGTYSAYLDDQEVSSLYETPDKFKQMRMPHFWMTYIQVDNADKTVEKARIQGAIIEMEQSLDGYGKVALIRDPQGAGFTIYEGDSITDVRSSGKANTLVWNELHVSDISKIIPFYEEIFDWTFVKKDDYRYEIYTGEEEHIADTVVIPNELKGKYEYWVCTFGVTDLQAAKNGVLDNGGTLIVDEGNRILMTDSGGVAFFYIQEV